MEPFTCPICGSVVRRSEYLATIFKDDLYALWMACLVTSYRHDHISYYDNTWRFPAYASKNPEYEDHESFKIKVNNRAKRQIIRALWRTKWPRKDKVQLTRACLRMQNNDQKTLALIESYIGKESGSATCKRLDDF